MNYFNFKAYEGTEPYIFVSYAHKDTELVLPILSALSDRGFRIWYDDGIAPGSEWPEYIAQHLLGSYLVMAFISPNAVDSPNCRREVTYALSKNKKFIGVFLQETAMSAGMEMQLSSQQNILLYNYLDSRTGTMNLSEFIQNLCTEKDILSCQQHTTAQDAQPDLPVVPEQTSSLSPAAVQTAGSVVSLPVSEKKKTPETVSITLRDLNAISGVYWVILFVCFIIAAFQITRDILFPVIILAGIAFDHLAAEFLFRLKQRRAEQLQNRQYAPTRKITWAVFVFLFVLNLLSLLSMLALPLMSLTTTHAIIALILLPIAILYFVLVIRRKLHLVKAIRSTYPARRRAQ